MWDYYVLSWSAQDLCQSPWIFLHSLYQLFWTDESTIHFYPLEKSTGSLENGKWLYRMTQLVMNSIITSAAIKGLHDIFVLLIFYKMKIHILETAYTSGKVYERNNRWSCICELTIVSTGSQQTEDRSNLCLFQTSWGLFCSSTGSPFYIFFHAKLLCRSELGLCTNRIFPKAFRLFFREWNAV